MSVTARLGIPVPEETDSADVPVDMGELAAVLDSAVIYGQGVIASRPTSTPGSPGIQARIYYATDENKHYWDTGTSWVGIGTLSPGSVGTTELADNSVTNPKMADNAIGTAELIDGSVTTPKLADGAVTTAKVNGALKPSVGAGAGTEALRALGTAAGMAAAGQHKSQHAPGAADPIDYTLVHMAGTLASRPAASANNAGLFYYANDNGQLYRSDGAVWTAIAAGTQTLTVAQFLALTGVITGQRVNVLVDGGQAIWTFQYNEDIGDIYKWVAVGEQVAIENYGTASAVNISNGSYASFTGPASLSVPIAGVYDVTVGCYAYASSASELLLAPSGAGLTAADANAARLGSLDSGENGSVNVWVRHQGSIEKTRRVPLTIGTLATQAKKTNTGGSGSQPRVTDPFLRVRPTRVTI